MKTCVLELLIDEKDRLDYHFICLCYLISTHLHNVRDDLLVYNLHPHVNQTVIYAPLLNAPPNTSRLETRKSERDMSSAHKNGSGHDRGASYTRRKRKGLLFASSVIFVYELGKLQMMVLASICLARLTFFFRNIAER